METFQPMIRIEFHGLVTIQENASHPDSTALALLRQTQQWGCKTGSMFSHPAFPSWHLFAMSCLRSQAVRKLVWVERMKAGFIHRFHGSNIRCFVLSAELNFKGGDFLQVPTAEK